MNHSPSPSKLCAALVLALGAVGAHAGAPDYAQVQLAGLADDTDRLIIKYRDAAAAGKSVAKVPALSKDRSDSLTRTGQQFGLGMKLSHTLATGAHVFRLGKKMSVADAQAVAADLMARDPSVEYAEPDRILHKLFVPNDARYNEQWDLFDATGGMRLPAAWDKSTGVGVNVAVLDTGFRPHADLAGQILPGYDFITSATIANDGNGRDSDAQDTGDAVVAGECGNGKPAADERSSWHGTHVAGTIAAATHNSAGVAGVAYGAKVVPVRVLGKCGGYTSDIADAMIWASGGSIAGIPVNPNKARVINLSLGGPGACDTTTQAAINSARSRGTVIVVAAGNENADAGTSNPANCAGVITVAATTRTGARAYYSNYGSVVDVAAPGGDARVAGGGILSTLNSGAGAPASDTYAFYQGTSMATPHVAGVVALMLAKNPNLTPDEVESKLKASARAFPASCSGCGSGIVDAAAAVDAAANTTTPPGLALNETESNNTLASANPVTFSGTTVGASMGSSTDTDYFVVQLPAGKSLAASMTLAPTADYDLYIYNSAGAILARSENSTGATDAATATNSGSTTAARYVRIVYYGGGTGATNGAYKLKLTW
ncbi:MAG: S8 family peptidase [Gammaproteobacteria bacterium]